MIDAMRRNQGGLATYRRRGDGNRVVELDRTTGALRTSLPTGPVALLLDSGRQRLYVTSREAGTLSVFDAHRRSLLQIIALPPHPNSSACDAKRNVLYVTVKNPAGSDSAAAESVVRVPLP